jgi:ferrous iron transport protein B
MKNKIRIALAGNPNVGKSTIFNALTGSRQHVGNWPGVTVEKKSGSARLGDNDIEIVDLPGTYSLTAYSADEVVARDYITDEKPDVVVHIMDATNFERNLYLTTQLLELDVPLVIALNMSDMAEKAGTIINRGSMEIVFGIPVVRTVGSRAEGLSELLRAAVTAAETSHSHEHAISYGAETERLISLLVAAMGRDPALAARYPSRWLAIRLLEGDGNVMAKLAGSPAETPVLAILKTVDLSETESAMADRRYEIISDLMPRVCTSRVKEMNSSDIIDRVITNRYLGIPIFLALMWGAFQLTFAAAAPFMAAIESLSGYAAALLSSMNIEPAWLGSLLGGGIIGGVGSVIVFLPNIFILLFLLSLLEDSGYLARAAFVMDRLMYSIGLPGKSFIPMLIGLGCNVPAIMATRTIEDKNDRLITILINPFMSCGARLPVFVLFAGIFFPANAGTMVFILYLIGIAVAIVSAWLFRRTILSGKPAPFLMEMPPYRLPTLSTSVRHMWDRGSMYIQKAAGIILAGAVIVWFLASFPYGVEYGGADSYAGMIGHLLQPLFAPLGFDWKIAVALMFGFIAKEIVVGSLGVLYGAGEDEGSPAAALLADPSFGPVTAFALMVFVLLYMPCIATLAVIRKETGSWKWTLFSIAYGISVAYLLALIIVHVLPVIVGRI